MKKIKYLYKQLCLLIFYIINRKKILKLLSENKEYVKRLEFYKIKNKAIQFQMIIMSKDLASYKNYNTNDIAKILTKSIEEDSKAIIEMSKQVCKVFPK